MQKIDLYNIISVVILVVAVASFFLAYVTDVEFAKRNLNTYAKQVYGQNIQLDFSSLNKTSLRIEIFKKQMFFIGLFFEILGVFMLLMRQKVISWTRRHRNVLLSLIAMFIVFIMLFIVSEIVTRIFFADVIYSEAGHGPGAIRLAKLANSQLNSFGYWDVEHSLTKPQGITRIIIFGDSYTHGFGLWDVNYSYPRVLQKLLDRKYGEKKFEVIKLALQGYSTTDHLNVLRDLGIKLNPDIIVLAYFANDVEGPGSRTGFEWFYYGHLIVPYEIGNVLYKHSLAYYFIESRMNNILGNVGVANSGSRYIRHLYSDSNPFFSKHSRYFDEFINISKQTNATIIVASIPVISDFRDYTYGYVNDYVKNISNQSEVYYLDYLPALSKYDVKDIQISIMDKHLNRFGNEIIANTLLEYMEKKGLLRWKKTNHSLAKSGSFYE